MRLRAATIRPVVACLLERPKLSAQAARTAGATCTTVMTSGSARARRTLLVSSRTVSAPVGQWVTHWPQKVQSVFFKKRL